MKPIWLRKVGKWNDSYYINIPKEIIRSIHSETLVISLESDKIVIMTPETAEKEIGVNFQKIKDYGGG